MFNHNVLSGDFSLPPTGGRWRWATANVLALGLHGALLLGLGYHLVPPLLPAAQPMVCTRSRFVYALLYKYTVWL